MGAGPLTKAGTAHDVSGLAAHVHDLVAKFEEPRRARERLRKEVAHIAFALDPGDANLELLHHVAHEEVTPLDVLHATVVFGIVGDVARALVVGADLRGTVDGAGVEVGDQTAEVDQSAHTRGWHSPNNSRDVSTCGGKTPDGA